MRLGVYLVIPLISGLVFGQTAAERRSTFGYFYSGAEWFNSFPDCGADRQSPIDIVQSKTTAGNAMSFELRLRSNNKTIDSKRSGGLTNSGMYSILRISNGSNQFNNFTALNYHAHVTSEHSIDGVFGDTEVHIVHQYVSPEGVPDATKLAVVGFIFKLSPDNTPSSFFNHWDVRSVSPTRSFNFAEAMADAVTRAKGYYRYSGSLTTPPCSQIVEWFVLDVFLPISREQVEYLRALFPDNSSFALGKGNNRLQQMVNGRQVLRQTFDQSNGFRDGFNGNSGRLFLSGLCSVLIWMIFDH